MFNQKNILTLEEALKWREQIKNNNKSLVITNGCFDILHAGHVAYLNESKKLANYQLVLLNSDQSIKKLKGVNRPIISEQNRAFLLSNIKSVDKVVIFNDNSCHNELKLLAPDIYTKASDYNLNNINSLEYDSLLSNNTKIIFLNIIQNISTTIIINKINNLYTKEG